MIMEVQSLQVRGDITFIFGTQPHNILRESFLIICPLYSKTARPRQFVQVFFGKA